MFFIALLVSSLAGPAVAQDSSPVVEPTTATPTFQSGVSNVRIDVQVTDNNNLVFGLTKEDFTVLDDGKRQPLVYFGRESEPLSLLLLLDVSGSTKQFIEQIADTARTALRYLRLKDRVAIMPFARETKVELPWTDDMTAVASALRDTGGDASLGAGTNINDSLLKAAKYIEETSGDKGRRAILILTDNLGLNFKSPDEPVIEAMHSADIVVNAIVVGKGRRPEPIKGNTYKNPDFSSPDVFGISEETGGEAVHADKAGETFATMIERIRTRYSLVFNKPAGAHPGFHNVTVMLSPEALARYPKAVLRYRKGYRIN
jgi:VWFA-related protein